MLRTVPQALLALSLVALLAACSPTDPSASGGGSTPAPTASSAGSPSVLPQIISRQQVVGPQRFVFSFLDAARNVPAAAPDRTASVRFHPDGADGPVIEAEGEFLWSIQDLVGVYVAQVDFPTPGPWIAEFTTEAPGAPAETIPFGFDVLEDGTSVAVGEAAPPSDTPTADDVGGDLAKLSTDEDPDPRFYETSVADALAAGEPFVLAFATPAFCQSQTCGPMLDRVKAVAPDYPDVAFINVEPYQLEVTEDGRLQPLLDENGGLQVVDAVNDWGLLVEPWVFVVDADGTVRASFEGALGEDELREALDALG